MEDLNCLKENARYASPLFMFVCPSRKKIDSPSKDYLIIKIKPNPFFQN